MRKQDTFKLGNKYTVLLFAALFLYGFSANGQAFEKGTKVIGAGIGIGSSLGGFNYSSQVPGLSLQYEQGVWDVGGPGVISLGGYVGYKSFSYETSTANFSATSKWNYTIIGLRSAYHYQGLDNDKVDLYAGLMFAGNLLNYSYRDSTGGSMSGGNYGNSSGFTFYLGGRYYFSENLGAFAELGYGVSYLNIGLVLKF